METDRNFYASAKTLARNPLGIIALFIVLVYAVASAVISLAKPEFYENPNHPAVLFLALFPVLVLLVFAFLVVRHHRNLYAPDDYADPKDFFHGLSVPVALSRTTTGAATSDMSAPAVEKEEKASIETSYNRLINFGFVLVHHAELVTVRKGPRTGRYNVRVWVEAIEQRRPLSDIASVAYHIWHDFKEPVLWTSDQRSQFDLWLSIYGEFPVLAIVTTKTGERHELQRFIDLPDRPPD
jgi:hypothetical protein